VFGLYRIRKEMLFACCVAALTFVSMLAQTVPSFAGNSRLAEFLPQVQPADLIPGADRFGPIESTPPVAKIFKGDVLLGYAYLNADIVNSTGYCGKPIHVLVGLTADAVIAGAKLVEHHEPIVLIGIPAAKINNFIAGYVGMKVLEQSAATAANPPVDIVSGATVTVIVIGDSLIRSGAKLARTLGLGDAKAMTAEAPAVKRTLDAAQTAPAGNWQTLVGDGSVRRLTLSVGEVNAAFERTGNAAAIERPEPGPAEDDFIDLYVGLVSVPSIGRALLGEAEYELLAQRLKPGQHAILVAGNGRYSFKGSGYVRGGIFDRFELIQGDSGVRFRDRTHKRLGGVAADGAPSFAETGLFLLPEDFGFDPTEPWRLQLLIQRATGALDKAFLTFDLGYRLPERYLKVEPVAVVAQPAEPAVAATEAAEEAPVPLWQRIWRNRLVDIGVLGTAITLLTGIFFFQDSLVKRPLLFSRLRTGFLVFTLFWLGWYATAQISVVNILTFTEALRTDFRWDYFLMDPLVFILWFSVAASMLFWGRGAFCGWLCPFGALQELSNRAARALRVPQIRVPFGLHQRLWPIKYMIFMVLFGLSLYSLAMAEKAAEVEPFKTAIILHFVRDWGFTLFAVALLAAGLFIERFFCRYLCPLGAALAIPARMRMFDWLRRYRDCGSPCQRCGNECPVQAIHPEGHINPNECIQCLHCQVLYHHQQHCPVVVQKRLKRERREALSSPTMAAPKPRARAALVTADPETGALSARPEGL
jgi:NosR/NirI family transcriptional regulator, nitrous oxide reductase regulator